MVSSMQESPIVSQPTSESWNFTSMRRLLLSILAKATCKRLGIAYSISSCKSFIHNAYMLERFIIVFGINPGPQVIDKLFKELIFYS